MFWIMLFKITATFPFEFPRRWIYSLAENFWRRWPQHPGMKTKKNNLKDPFSFRWNTVFYLLWFLLGAKHGDFSIILWFLLTPQLKLRDCCVHSRFCQACRHIQCQIILCNITFFFLNSSHPPSMSSENNSFYCESSWHMMSYTETVYSSMCPTAILSLTFTAGLGFQWLWRDKETFHPALHKQEYSHMSLNKSEREVKRNSRGCGKSKKRARMHFVYVHTSSNNT